MRGVIYLPRPPPRVAVRASCLSTTAFQYSRSRHPYLQAIFCTPSLWSFKFYQHYTRFITDECARMWTSTLHWFNDSRLPSTTRFPHLNSVHYYRNFLRTLIDLWVDIFRTQFLSVTKLSIGCYRNVSQALFHHIFGQHLDKPSNFKFPKICFMHRFNALLLFVALLRFVIVVFVINRNTVKC